MKKILFVIRMLSLSLIVAACSDGGGNSEQSNSQAQISSVKSMSGDARLDAEATKTDDGRIVVTGNTNLPDSTELLVSISNEAAGFTAQDESIVSNGKFSAGPFGPKFGLKIGDYVVEVIMPATSVQPKSVKLIVGNEGQYLTGPLVKDSSLGGKTVKYSFLMQ